MIKDIRRATRKQFGTEETIRIVLDGLRGEEPIAALCRREGIADSLYYNWLKGTLEASKRRLADDTARAAVLGRKRSSTDFLAHLFQWAQIVRTTPEFT